MKLYGINELKHGWFSTKYSPTTSHGSPLRVTQTAANFVLEIYGSAEGPPRGVENRNLLSHPDDLSMEAYVIRMT